MSVSSSKISCMQFSITEDRAKNKTLSRIHACGATTKTLDIACEQISNFSANYKLGFKDKIRWAVTTLKINNIEQHLRLNISSAQKRLKCSRNEVLKACKENRFDQLVLEKLSEEERKTVIVISKLTTQFLAQDSDFHTAFSKAQILAKKIPPNAKVEQMIEQALLADNLAKAILPGCKNDYEKAIEMVAKGLHNFEHEQTDERESLEIYPQAENSSEKVHIYRIHKDQQLGKGNASKAKVCEDVVTHKEYCRLGMTTGNTYPMKPFILDFLRNPHRGILQMKDISPAFEGKRGQKKKAFITEKYDSTLDALLNKKTLTAEQKIKITTDILIGLQTLHDAGIAHNDLKPQNILVRFNQNTQEYEAVICDFDMSCAIDDSLPGGSPFYCAPEVFYKSNFDTASKDMYEMGRALLELWKPELEQSHSNILHYININNGLAFPTDFTRRKLLKQELAERHEQCNPLPTDIPIAHFIHSLMILQPNARLSSEEALTEFNTLVPHFIA